ncbi:Voltage-dependent T-type calcium channel subunit alpha-1H [Durusdinium trenchii]|uniref:Voltage-dependent T-type calcium channel subunit alpha-1H n=1 Tax=Durusdinium trenchii TaxID=1381693 RepID=A0ABP0IMC8_9DINO
MRQTGTKARRVLLALTPNCTASTSGILLGRRMWIPRVKVTWTLDDCFKSGTIGLAYVGTICQMEKNYWGQRPNTAVVWHNFRTWITFAHETGHIFGGEHSFELGQGTTGGIMDYGDGQLDGKFQFNTQFRKKKMCQTMDQVVKNKCGAIWLFDGECGNGILTDQEECECADGSKNCTYCKDCTLDANKFCTPDGYGVHPIGLGVGTGDCCTQNGTFRKSGSFCHVPGVGNGYCTAGLCIPSKCSDYHFVGDFCGLQAQNECKFMCMDQNHACSTMDGWLVRQEPANYVRDQVPCNWRRGSDGICMKGSCVPAVEGCGNSLHEEGEQCECQDGSRTCRFCSDCKLEKGKDCSPDDENGACCSKDGFFKDGECIWNGVKGYCMQGRCQDTPCSTYKSWDGWGEFCGLQEGNSCKFKCEVHGTCDTLEKFLLAGQPMNQFPDGTPCSLKGGFGSCKDGQCQVIEEVKEEEHQGAKSEVVDLQPGGEKADTWNHHEGVNDEDLEDQEAPPDSTECGECLNGVNCNIIRAWGVFFPKFPQEIEKDFGCDCSSCSACAEEQQPKEKYQGCEKTCGGILWWAKSCDTHIWNARVQGHKGHARTTCKGLKNRWNCNCDGCLLCEEEFDEAKMME